MGHIDRMRLAQASTLAAIVALRALAFPSCGLAADPGETGLAFLKIGVGARAAAMGEAYVAVAQDASAVYWNPAGIANTPDFELHATHHEWISDARYEFLSAVQGLRGHALGAHVSLLHLGEFEGRDGSGNFTESFRAYDFSAGLTYGRRVMRDVEVGASGKLLYEKIHDFDAIGFAVDLGLRYRTPIRGLTVGATATNLGPEMKFVDDSFLLPAQARIGAAFRTRKLLKGLTLSSDLRFPNDSDAKGHIGGELWVHEIVAIRGGAKLGYDEEAGTVGLGLAYRDYLFDYAFVPFSETSELGDTHRFSVGWHPGAVETP
jgi:hypothetical protein